jgi:hypothetical protein
MPAGFRFLVNRFAVTHDLESATPRRNHFDLHFGKTRANLSRQTGGSGLVVSNDTILDADQEAFHFAGATG